MSLQSIYSQIFSLGFIWTFFHCVPMCGPIVGGLPMAPHSSGSVSLSLHHFVLYQAGRSIVYSIFGAFAGALGSRFQMLSPEWGWILVVFLLFILGGRFLPSELSEKLTAKISSILSRMLRWNVPLGRAFFFGLVFGFLPCSLTLWVLSLAAATGSVWHGVMVMNFLILLTCIPLTVAILGGEWLRHCRLQWMGTAALSVSVLWTSLSTAAACGWIDHQQFHFELFGHHYMLMTW